MLVLYYVWSGRHGKEVANEICECNLITPLGDSFNCFGFTIQHSELRAIPYPDRSSVVSL